MTNEKSINDQINEIIERQYNGYRGKKLSHLKFLHGVMRSAYGDQMFLAYLEKQERDNPKPVYAKEKEPGNI
jgi:hypothetical protein